VNHEYRLLKDLWCDAMGTTIEATRFVGMDFADPDLNMQKIAEGFGARVETIETLQSVADTIRRALAHEGPSFLLITREP
jgi:benzoylformate decarboxylase